VLASLGAQRAPSTAEGTVRVRSTLTHLECSICGERHDADVLQTVCTVCGRALLARYDLDVAARTFGRDALLARPPDLWRYQELLPVRDPQFVASLGEGVTPLLAVPLLGDALGTPRLHIKDEGQNPTGTFKARGMTVAVSRAMELGARVLAAPTAGNAGSALAAYAARAGVDAHVAMPSDAPPAVIDEVRWFGGELTLVDGHIGAAGAVIRDGAARHGWFDLSTLREPYRLEGKKTMGFELWEQLGQLPDVVLYPTGGGTGLIGMWKAFEELEAMGLIGSGRPRMVAVQAEGCAPIVRAFEAGDDRATAWEQPSTIAPGIRVPAPFADDLILNTLRASDGEAVAVGDGAIRSAMAEIGRLTGVDACPEGAATLAGLRKLLATGRIDPEASIVLFNTGTGLKHPELREG
jgi:threonine synthase